MEYLAVRILKGKDRDVRWYRNLTGWVSSGCTFHKSSVVINILRRGKLFHVEETYALYQLSVKGKEMISSILNIRLRRSAPPAPQWTMKARQHLLCQLESPSSPYYWTHKTLNHPEFKGSGMEPWPIFTTCKQDTMPFDISKSSNYALPILFRWSSGI